MNQTPLSKDDAHLILRTFLKKADFLASLPFAKYLCSHGPSTEISGKRVIRDNVEGFDITVTRTGPTENDLHAFYPTFRLFFNKSDSISLHRIEKAFSFSTVPKDILESHKRNIQRYEKYLSQTPRLSFQGMPSFTRKTIIHHFLEGDSTHAKIHDQTFKRMQQILAHPFAHAIFFLEFYEGLRATHDLIQFTRENHVAKALGHLEGESQ